MKTVSLIISLWACLVFVLGAAASEYEQPHISIQMEGVAEADKTNPGGFVKFNNDDDDANQTPDYEDDPPTTGEDDLVAIYLYHATGDQEGSVVLTIQTAGAPAGSVKIYESSDRSGPLDDLTWSEDDISTDSSMPTILYVEGSAPSAARGDVQLIVTWYDGFGEVLATDQLNLTVISLDLRMDSDNDGGDPAAWQPLDDEDKIEYDDDKPGRIVGVNNGDLGMDPDWPSDGIPDYVEGFDSQNQECNHPVPEILFVPIKLTLPAGLDLSGATIRFTYSASDPAGVTRTGEDPNYSYQPAEEGAMRIWKLEATQLRNKAVVHSGTSGNYVAPDIDYAPEDLGLSATTRQVTLYVEGIKPCAVGAETIEVEFQGGGFSLSDRLRVTFVQMDLRVFWQEQELTLREKSDPGLLLVLHNGGGVPPQALAAMFWVDFSDAFCGLEIGKVTLSRTSHKIAVWKDISGEGCELVWDDPDYMSKAYGLDPEQMLDMFWQLTAYHWMEGREPSAQARDTELLVEYYVGGMTACSQRVKITVAYLDMDVDSDNTSGLAPPERDDWEDLIEDDSGPGFPGKFVAVNDDDADNDGVADLNQPLGHAIAGKHFTPLVVDFPVTADATKARVRFTYPGCEPGSEEQAVPGAIRIWTKDACEARGAGDYIRPFSGPDDVYSASSLGLCGGTAKTFYIEGIAPSNEPGGTRIVVEVDPDGDGPYDYVLADAVRVTVIRIDLDIDSDNNNGFDPPDRSMDEDRYEDKTGDAARPGKYIEVNANDADGDGIPDYADGYDLDNQPGNEDDVTEGKSFVPLVLQIPAPIDVDTARLKITYDASAPAELRVSTGDLLHSYTPAPGSLRIWKFDGGYPRNKGSARLDPQGDYVEPGEYAAGDLGFTNSTRTVTFYVEGVSASAAPADKQIKVELDPLGQAGGAGWVASDAVRVTVVRADLRIDSNNDYIIGEEDDPIEERAPGCIIPKDAEGDGSGLDILAPLELQVSPVLTGGTVILDSSSGGICVWADSAKTVPIILPKTYTDAAALPGTLYVDGLSKGANPDITLEYKDRDGRTVARDKVKVLVTETVSWSPAMGQVALAWISDPGLGTGDVNEFEDQLKFQGFVVIRYLDSLTNDTNFEQCTLGNYRAIMNCGAYTAVSHGEPGAHYAVYAEDTAAGLAACDNWRGNEIGMTTEHWPTLNCYTVRVSSNWLAANVSCAANNNKTITLWSICFSAQPNSNTGEAAVKEAAGGRWRSGYLHRTNEAEPKAVNKKFLERMNGTTDNARKRTAGEAWDWGANYTTNCRMDGNPWTTLCPAPMADDACWPPDDTDPAGRYGAGAIVFDTYMNGTVGAETALILEIGGPVYGVRWSGNQYGLFMIRFDYRRDQGQPTRMTARAINCMNQDPAGGRRLDGDRVTPNGDDKSWQY